MNDEWHTKLGPGLDRDPLQDKQKVRAQIKNRVSFPLQRFVMQPCLHCGGTGEIIDRYDGDDYCDGCDLALDIIHSEAEIQEVLEALINEYTLEEVEQCLNYLRPA